MNSYIMCMYDAPIFELADTFILNAGRKFTSFHGIYQQNRIDGFIEICIANFVIGFV